MWRSIHRHHQHGEKENESRGILAGHGVKAGANCYSEHTQDGERKRIDWKANISVFEKCFLITFMYFPRERSGEFFALVFFSLHLLRPHFLPLAALWPQRQVGSVKEGRKQAREGWKCLSERLNDAICQKHPFSLPPSLPPSLNPPPLLTPAMTSPPGEAAWQRTVAWLRASRWKKKLFPTAVTLLWAVANCFQD